MKTQNTKLAFTKNAVTELNNDQLSQIQGGFTPLYPLSVITPILMDFGNN